MSSPIYSTLDLLSTHSNLQILRLQLPWWRPSFLFRPTGHGYPKDVRERYEWRKAQDPVTDWNQVSCIQSPASMSPLRPRQPSARTGTRPRSTRQKRGQFLGGTRIITGNGQRLVHLASTEILWRRQGGYERRRRFDLNAEGFCPCREGQLHPMGSHEDSTSIIDQS